MEDAKLKNILWEHICYEFGKDISDSDYKEAVKDFIKEYKEDEVSLAHSYFGDTITFGGSTKFIPSQKKLIKDIYNFETERSIREVINFDTIEEIENYFGPISFDELLEPSFDEEILLKLT